MIFIWLDDEREMPTTKYHEYKMFHAHNYEECIEIIDYALSRGEPIYIHFDHDLGAEKSGYDVAKYIVTNEIPLKYFSIHSMNPAGTMNIYKLLSHYGYEYTRL